MQSQAKVYNYMYRRVAHTDSSGLFMRKNTRRDRRLWTFLPVNVTRKVMERDKKNIPRIAPQITVIAMGDPRGQRACSLAGR